MKPFDLGPYRYGAERYFQALIGPVLAAGLAVFRPVITHWGSEVFLSWRLLGIVASGALLFSTFQFVKLARAPLAFKVEGNRLIALWWRRSSEFHIPDLLLRENRSGFALSDGKTELKVSSDLIGYHELIKLLRAARIRES